MRSSPGLSEAKRLPGLVLLVLAFVLAAMPARAQTPSPTDIKAAFLFNFTRFVTWPAGAHDGPAEPFVIGLIGSDPFDGQLGSILAGRTVGNRKIEVRKVATPADARACKIVYVAGDRGPALAALGDHPVLTVGDGEDFCRAGGTVGFLLAEDRIKLCVNVDSASRAGIRISAQLLKISTIVRGGP